MNRYRSTPRLYKVTGCVMWFTQERYLIFFWRDCIIEGSGVYFYEHQAYEAINGVSEEDKTNFSIEA